MGWSQITQGGNEDGLDQNMVVQQMSRNLNNLASTKEKIGSYLMDLGVSRPHPHLCSGPIGIGIERGKDWIRRGLSFGIGQSLVQLNSKRHELHKINISGGE